MNKYVIFVVMARRFFRAFDQWLCQIFLAHFADGSQVFYPSDVIFVTATATLDARHSRFWSPSIQTCISVRPKFKLIQKDSPSLIIQFTNDNWCISTSCWISCLYFKMINIPNMNEWIQWGEKGGRGGGCRWTPVSLKLLWKKCGRRECLKKLEPGKLSQNCGLSINFKTS